MDIVEITKSIPGEILTFFLAMTPIVELRGSIPFGITVLNMSPLAALIYSLLGNTLIAIILIYILDPITKFLCKHSKVMNRFFEKLFQKTRTKHSKRMSEIGHLALLIFVAIPMPGSGAWSGVLAAYVFGVKAKIALPLITVGLIIAGLLVTYGTQILIYLFQ